MELICLVLISALTFCVLKLWLANRKFKKNYSKIIDIHQAEDDATKAKENVEREIELLRSSYEEKKAIFDRLQKEAAIYDDSIELADLGFYEPHYDFGTSLEYKNEIDSVRERQKNRISTKIAIYCTKEWTVSGSKSEGRTMTNRGIRLTARAFNNECDAAISNTNWNNVNRMEQRINKAFTAINKLNESNAIIIDGDYLKLKIEELHLTHEYKDKKQQEKEEQAEIKRQMREEAKFEKESEQALKEEEKYNKLLEKARSEAEKATGPKLEKLQERILSLDKELVEAHAKSERAKSMAQQTKSGHVYVISNIGSFGEDIYKIGMTRRLEPHDRVKELGDASVPFTFDIHAMIYTEDAPALENMLHKSFDSKRLNLVNNRKEFFNVTLGEISKEVKKISPDSEFHLTAEARQYRESQAIRSQKEKQKSASSLIPEAI